MTSGFSRPSSSRKRRAERLGVLRAELEDVADLDRSLELERAAARPGTCRLGCACADVGERRGRSRGPAWTPRRWKPSRFAPATYWPVPQREVGDDLAVDSDRAERAAGRAERSRGSARRSPARNAATEDRRELRLLEPVVTADESEDDRRSTVSRRASPSRSRSDRRRGTQRTSRSSRRRASRPRSGASSGSGKLGRARHRRARPRRQRRSRRSRRRRARSRRTSAGARKSRDSLPPIIPGSASTSVRLEPAPLEDARVRLLVLREARVEPGLVAVERVRVLHDELAQRGSGRRAGAARRAP